jgi:hypothetical protein
MTGSTPSLRRPSRRGVLGRIGSALLGGGLLTGAAAGRSVEPSFFVRSIQPEDATVDLGETLAVSGQVVNLGTAGTRTVEYRVDEATRRTEEVSLDAAGETTVTFEGISTEELGAGSFTHGIYTDNTGKQGSLVVQNVGVFEISDLTPRLGGAQPGGRVDVTVTVTNTGEASGSQTVRLLLDGEESDTALVGLSPGDSQEVSLTLTAPEQEGEYTHEVETEDDRVTGSVSVTATPGDGGETGTVSPELLLALGGGGGALALYGAYAYLSRRGDDGTASEMSAEGAGDDDVPAASTGPANTGGSTVLAAVIDDNLDACDDALSEAEAAIERGDDEAAMAARERARAAATDAREAAESYDPDRLDAVESRLERVRDLEARIERDGGER